MPQKMNPFGNQVVCTAILFLVGTACNLALMLSVEHPTQPYKNFRTAFINAVLMVVQCLGALTDMGIVNVLATQV
jgi:hypothetical protein